MREVSLLIESLLAAGMDLRHRRLSNRFLMGCLLWNLAICLGQRAAMPWSKRLTGFLLPLLLLPWFCRGGIGAGDLKLFMVLGLLLGEKCLGYLWGTFAAAAVMGLIAWGAAGLRGSAWRPRRLPLAAAGVVSLLLQWEGWCA